MAEYEAGFGPEEKLKSLKSQKKAAIRAVKESARTQIDEIKRTYAKNPERYQAKLDAKLRRGELRLERRNARIAAKEAQRIEDAKFPKRYSMGEEIFNSVSHGVGAGLSVAAIVLLVVKAALYSPAGQTPLYVTSVCVFGGSLLILYLMSTLYHALTPYHVKNVFQIFDHSSIYLLIAGTYTPFCLLGIQGARGWIMFGIIWALAAAGITIYATMGNKMRLFSAVTYVIMGWIIVFAFRDLWRNLPHISSVMLITGGIAYTAGCPFYMLKKIKWTHSIFHLFILVGSVLHFFAVYYMF